MKDAEKIAELVRRILAVPRVVNKHGVEVHLTQAGYKSIPNYCFGLPSGSTTDRVSEHDASIIPFLMGVAKQLGVNVQDLV